MPALFRHLPHGCSQAQRTGKTKKIDIQAREVQQLGLCIAFCKHNALSLSSPYQPPADSLDS